MKWESGDPKIAAVFSERRGTSIGRERGSAVVPPGVSSPTGPHLSCSVGAVGMLVPCRGEGEACEGKEVAGLVGSTMLSAGGSFLPFLSACSFGNSSVVGRSRREPDRPIQKAQDLCERAPLCWAELPAGAVLLHFQNDTHPQFLDLC